MLGLALRFLLTDSKHRKRKRNIKKKKETRLNLSIIINKKSIELVPVITPLARMGSLDLVADVDFLTEK